MSDGIMAQLLLSAVSHNLDINFKRLNFKQHLISEKHVAAVYASAFNYSSNKSICWKSASMSAVGRQTGADKFQLK